MVKKRDEGYIKKGEGNVRVCEKLRGDMVRYVVKVDNEDLPVIYQGSKDVYTGSEKAFLKSQQPWDCNEPGRAIVHYYTDDFVQIDGYGDVGYPAALMILI